MQVAFKVNGKIRSKIKSTIHVDNTARIQTVTKRYNIKFWKLIPVSICALIVEKFFNCIAISIGLSHIKCT